LTTRIAGRPEKRRSPDGAESSTFPPRDQLPLPSLERKWSDETLVIIEPAQQ
jgi:hypothetical protein